MGRSLNECALLGAVFSSFLPSFTDSISIPSKLFYIISAQQHNRTSNAFATTHSFIAQIKKEGRRFTVHSYGDFTSLYIRARNNQED
ncbi:hypothetical protein P8452_51812 [Trifolium repens]|nr:hypothetical protein P8452_51812 [Trifolium repens]